MVADVGWLHAGLGVGGGVDPSRECSYRLW